MPANLCFKRNFEICLPDRSEWVNKEPPKEADIVVYTDRSKTEEGIKAEVFCEEMDSEVSISLGSVDQSEISQYEIV